jgi:hypothetical protein
MVGEEEVAEVDTGSGRGAVESLGFRPPTTLSERAGHPGCSGCPVCISDRGALLHAPAVMDKMKKKGDAMKKIFIALLVCLVASAAYADGKRFNVPVDGSPYMGGENAKVTIVEFIDYQ